MFLLSGSGHGIAPMESRLVKIQGKIRQRLTLGWWNVSDTVVQ